jgi:hypothetical protein
MMMTTTTMTVLLARREMMMTTVAMNVSLGNSLSVSRRVKPFVREMMM